MAVASAGPYASLHLTPDRQSRQHPTTQFFTGRMPFLPPNQQRQGTEGDNNQQKQAAAGCTNDSEKLRNCCQLPNNLGSHLIGSFRIPYTSQWARICPRTAPSPGGSGPPPNVWFLAHNRVHIPNRISISSAIQTQHTDADHATPVTAGCIYTLHACNAA